MYHGKNETCDTDVHEPKAEHIFLRSSHTKGIKFSANTTMYHYYGNLSDVMEKHTFTIDAFVLLPDHLHCLWTLPDGDHDFSRRWRLIKSYFTRKCDDKYKHTPSALRQPGRLG